MTGEPAVGRRTYGGGSRGGSERERRRRGADGGDSRRKLFLPRVLRGKHGNPVTREEESALFKEARDVSKFSQSFSRFPFTPSRLLARSREHVRELR